MIARLVRGIGWTFITSGTLVLLFLVYLLLYTDLRGAQAQAALADEFRLGIGDVASATDATSDDAAGEPVSDAALEIGDAWGAITFERNGQRIIYDEPRYIVEGTDLGSLQFGPGHYPDTAQPGQVGNVGLAGHRTTYNADFADIEQLVPGDVVIVVDRDLRRWRYRVLEPTRGSRLDDTAAGIIVQPSDTWVVGSDPLESGGDRALLTLTTCHPRFSAAQRLIVFAELIGDADGASEQTGEVDELVGEEGL